MRTSPEVGRSRPPTRLSSVDLPEPDGPMIDTISPALDGEAHAVEGDDLALALELLGHVVERDHGAHRVISLCP